MNATAEKTDIVEKFREFEKEHGPSYIYGHVVAPYSGCGHLNACAIVKGDFAYVTADLEDFWMYRDYVTTPPEGIEARVCTIGCVRLEDIEKVLREPEFRRGLEFHSLDDLAPNVPYALTSKVIDMCAELDYAAILEGQFRCKVCERDLLTAESIEYFEGDFRGNGGIGIEVGAPVCSECFSLHHCCHCAEEVEPEFQMIDSEEHCIYCCPNKTCSCCGEVIDISWHPSETALKGYRAGRCEDCQEEVNRAEIENARYKKAEAATGSLFPE